MNRVLVCTVDAAPCPAESQQWVPVMDLAKPAELGFTPEAVAAVAGWGVGAVLLLWSLGYAVGAALKLIRMV